MKVANKVVCECLGNKHLQTECKQVTLFVDWLQRTEKYCGMISLVNTIEQVHCKYFQFRFT